MKIKTFKYNYIQKCKLMNKSGHIKSVLFISIIFLTLLIPIAFAGWFDFFKSNGITGKVVNGTNMVTLSIGNTAPFIDQVSNISDVVINASTTTQVNMWYIVNDSNGVSDIKDSSARVFFTKTGETTRSNTSCRRTANISGVSANFSCGVKIWYYDAGSAWTVNVSINDTGNNLAYNDSTTFNIMSSIHINMSNNTLTWNSLTVGATDIGAILPINLTNVGNQNITNITIKAYDLLGELYNDTIGVGNFSVKNQSGCNGYNLVNDTKIQGIYNTIPRFTKGNNNQSIYYCIESVPNVNSDTYNSTSPWITTAEG